MRSLPAALLLIAALALAGCAADDADESASDGAGGRSGGASEVSSNLTVVGGEDPSANETAATNASSGSR